MLWSICTVSVFRCPSPVHQARWTTASVPATSLRRASQSTHQVHIRVPTQAAFYSYNQHKILFKSFFFFCVCVCVCVVAGVAHRLHSKHGKNVVLLGDGCQAVRVGGYAHGIVFSAKELKADELFEVNVCSRKMPPLQFFVFFL